MIFQKGQHNIRSIEVTTRKYLMICFTLQLAYTGHILVFVFKSFRVSEFPDITAMDILYVLPGLRLLYILR